jgi:hypothetical protein
MQVITYTQISVFDFSSYLASRDTLKQINIQEIKRFF